MHHTDTSIPLILDIKRSSLDDGPGIRTVVFLKGCPLRCTWCHNPESQSLMQEIAFYPEFCIGCRKCLEVCPAKAIDMSSSERISRSLCRQCGQCTDVCYALALRKLGQLYPPDQLVEILLRDRIFYENSAGGVTFSGGEPMLHMDYISEVMMLLKKENIHIAIETSGYFAYPKFAERILPYLDLVMYDLKLFDPNLHEQYTGKDNARILSNFHQISSEKRVQVIPRTPLIPGITDSEENLQAIAKFLEAQGYAAPQLLPYNESGLIKRKRLGK